MVLDTRLQGSVYAQLDAARRQLQKRYVDSRLFAAKTSLSAFATQPLHGIGWGRFTDYAAAHGSYGHLPTHDEYLRFLAELGAIGVLLLGWVGGVVAWALRRTAFDALGIAILGMLATGVVGLLFINGLVAPDVMLPLAFAAAIACARAADRDRRHPASRSDIGRHRRPGTNATDDSTRFLASGRTRARSLQGPDSLASRVGDDSQAAPSAGPPAVPLGLQSVRPPAISGLAPPPLRGAGAAHTAHCRSWRHRRARSPLRGC